MTVADHFRLAGYAALVAFVLAVVGMAIGYLIQRNQRHHTAIARLEYNLAHALLRLDQSLTVMSGVRETLRAEKRKVSLFPSLFDLDGGPCMDLYNEDLRSRVIVVNMSMYASNRTLESFRDSYVQLLAGAEAGTTDQATYRANADALAAAYLEMDQRLRALRPRLEDVLGRLRVLGQKDRPFLLGLLGKFLKSGEVTEAELKEAIESRRAELSRARPQTPTKP